MWKTDREILWALPSVINPDAFTAVLEGTIDRWNQSTATNSLESAYARELEGRAVNVSFVPAVHTEDACFALFTRPAREPYVLRAYKTLWSDAWLQQCIVDHSLRPRRCAWGVNLATGAESFTAICTGDGFQLSAVVDGLSFALVESAITATP